MLPPDSAMGGGAARDAAPGSGVESMDEEEEDEEDEKEEDKKERAGRRTEGILELFEKSAAGAKRSYK